MFNPREIDVNDTYLYNYWGSSKRTLKKSTFVKLWQTSEYMDDFMECISLANEKIQKQGAIGIAKYWGDYKGRATTFRKNGVELKQLYWKEDSEMMQQNKQESWSSLRKLAKMLSQ